MKKLLVDTYKAFAGNLEFSLRGLKYAPDELIVLCMHSTPIGMKENFKRIVDMLSVHFKALNPADFEAYFRGELNAGPYILYTFDDGLKNNLHAAEVLEAKGIKAVFFIVPDFVHAGDGEAYYRTHIRRHIDEAFAKSKEDLTPMSEADLRDLSARGHLIGSHTMSHLLRATSSAEEIEREVAGSKESLDQITGREVNTFCSPIHTALSVDDRIQKAIRTHYRFHFTTFPGKHSERKDPLMIYRRNIEVDWPVGKIRFALGEWDLRRWKSGIAQWRALCSQP